MAPGKLRLRPEGLGPVAVLILTDQAAGLGGREVRLHGHLHPLGLAALIGGAGLGKELPILRRVLMDAEHVPAQLMGIVALGEALPGEGPLQLGAHGVGDLHAVQHSPVDPGHYRHIFRPLHPALDFQGGDAHVPQLPQVVQQAVVLQAQGVLGFKTTVAVVHAAGLGTAAPVAAAAADDAGEVALAGVAHTQGPVNKYLDLDGAHGADLGDLLPAQFPGQDHPADAHVRRLEDAGDGVDSHLRGSMDRHLACPGPAQSHQTEILDDEGVHACLCGGVDDAQRLVHLPIQHQCI